MEPQVSEAAEVRGGREVGRALGLWDCRGRPRSLRGPQPAVRIGADWSGETELPPGSQGVLTEVLGFRPAALDPRRWRNPGLTWKPGLRRGMSENPTLHCWVRTSTH